MSYSDVVIAIAYSDAHEVAQRWLDTLSLHDAAKRLVSRPQSKGKR